MQDIEPFFGWLKYYSNEADSNSPFQDVTHNAFEYDRNVYEYLAHPLWDDIDSDSLLVKILYANYDDGYAIIELFGVWNDLILNDFKLFSENCLTYLVDAGINKFVFIAENILNIYLDADDYYEAMQEELNEGWMALIKPRQHVIQEIEDYGIGQYFFWNDDFEELNWRKLKPWELFQLVDSKMTKLLN